MSLNDTPSGERIHIGFFGRRNAGKSSIVNCVTGQNLSIVSERKGTTTDPVYKAMELLPLGPVEIIDTPGYDDEGELGELRVARTRQVLGKTDIAVLVIDGTLGESPEDRELENLFREEKMAYVVVWNKADQMEPEKRDAFQQKSETAGKEHETGAKGPQEKGKERIVLWASSATGEGIPELKGTLAHLAPEKDPMPPLVMDLLHPGDVVILVIPIDESAPKGRIILPQQQVLREVLDCGAIAMSCRESELAETLGRLKEPPALVITDSQAFGIVSKIVPEDVLLTSFSILMARHKGFLDTALAGIATVDQLQDGDRVLIAEGCTHHRQCNDIGTVKIPRWLREHTNADFLMETCSGREFPEDLSDYRLVIHCGSCMLNDREVQSRMRRAVKQGIPFLNYGVFIAYTKGILQHSVKVLEKELETN